jgi:hypothetical protein
MIAFGTACRNVPAMNRKRFSVVANLSVWKSHFRTHALPFASSLASSSNLICASYQISSSTPMKGVRNAERAPISRRIQQEDWVSKSLYHLTSSSGTFT